MSYTQLTQEERYQIYALKKAGHIQAEIAEIVGRDPRIPLGNCSCIALPAISL